MMDNPMVKGRGTKNAKSMSDMISSSQNGRKRKSKKEELLRSRSAKHVGRSTPFQGRKSTKVWSSVVGRFGSNFRRRGARSRREEESDDDDDDDDHHHLEVLMRRKRVLVVMDVLKGPLQNHHHQGDQRRETLLNRSCIDVHSPRRYSRAAPYRRI